MDGQVLSFNSDEFYFQSGSASSKSYPGPGPLNDGDKIIIGCGPDGRTKRRNGQEWQKVNGKHFPFKRSEAREEFPFAKDERGRSNSCSISAEQARKHLHLIAKNNMPPTTLAIYTSER